jgi:mutator protein MutT
MRKGVVVVVRRAGRLLVIRRAAHIVAGGAWCFVGGAIDPGETPEQAVVREFQEEVGGQVRPVRPIWHYMRPDRSLRLEWWLAELDGEELTPNPAEVADLRWCTPDEIEELPGILENNLTFLNVVGRKLVEGEG